MSLIHLTIIFNSSGTKKNKQKIWGKAQRESARRPKSDWGDNLEAYIFCSKVTWPVM